MRITTGNLKGRTINFPVGLSKVVRPLSERVRKAIFDKIQFLVEGSFVLDLFCGSGSFGIEALSRGAKFVCFVDNNELVVSILKQNLDFLKINKDNYSIIFKDIFKLSEKDFLDFKFDIIFIGPPYKLEAKLIEDFLNKFSLFTCFKKDALLIIEQSKRTNLNPTLLNLLDIKDYGDTKIFYYKKN